MKILLRICFWLCLVCCATAALVGGSHGHGRTTTYIVHMAHSQMPQRFSSHEHWHTEAVQAVLPADEQPQFLYHYTEAFHGFAVRLTPSQAAALEQADDAVLGIFPETVYQLHTTRSPEFLGLGSGADSMWPEKENFGHDVVVGVLDTGVWPESASFADHDMGPVPQHWRGACETGTHFSASNCNNKLVGARFFCHGYEAAVGPINETSEFRSPRDQDGHGTHTAATAAGALASGASLLGYASGNARGMATRARVAAYKVCWTGGCFSSDIMAALDRAVADGCDVLSMSLGGGMEPFFRDSISLGAFAAMERGVFVSCSAGNGGPSPASLSNVAPWITTVGASTLDRDFPAYVELGNGMNFSGVSLYHGRRQLPVNQQLPLVYDSHNGTASPASLCMAGSMDPSRVRGKVVVCDRGVNARVAKGAVVRAAGGSGMILANTASNGEELVADCHLLPASAVGQKFGDEIKAYIARDPRPTATIRFGGTVLGVKPSPVVAAFSSRGPNILNPEILKPDLVAPGVNILAAWTGAAGPTGLASDERRVHFNIISGTSMSCPHVSGLAALLKGAHPDWSPAAIRSALMTTSYVTDNSGGMLLDAATDNASTAFDHGAGHVDPRKALNPGLVYDIGPDDYIEFLCALRYTPAQIRTLAKRSYTCRNTLRTPGDLNYPAMAALFPVGGSGSGSEQMTVTYTRTLTNVGQDGARYEAAVTTMPEAEIGVEPRTLYFAKVNDKQSFRITFTAKPMQLEPGILATVSGALTWSDGVHSVRSPIALMWQASEMR